MNNFRRAEKKLREQQLESYGRLMAGLSHDLKNHLGIIRESSGLISDMLETQKESLDPVFASRVLSAAATIEKRVVSVADMLHNLSSFSHRSDCIKSSILLEDIICELAVFLRRFAAMKQVKLELVCERNGAAVLTVPTVLHHLIYRLFLFALQQTATGDTLIIGNGSSKDNNSNSEYVYFTIKNMELHQEGLHLEEYEIALQTIHGNIFIENNKLVLGVASQSIEE